MGDDLLEVINENIQKYNENIVRISEEKKRIKQKIKDIEIQKGLLEDYTDISKLEIEQADLMQQLASLTYSYRASELNLEELNIRKAVCEKRMDKREYAEKIAKNRSEKLELVSEREVACCECEINKLEKALDFARLSGDRVKVQEYEEAIENQKDILRDLESKLQKMRGQEDVVSEEEENKEDPYSFKKEDNIEIETTEQTLIDHEGKEIGSRTVRWTTDIDASKSNVEIENRLEDKEGKYLLKETIKYVSDVQNFHRKELTVWDKQNCDKLQYVYQKDSNGTELYYEIANGENLYRVTRNEKGTKIIDYEEGKVCGTFEYDRDGKAIVGAPGIDQIPDTFTEDRFVEVEPFFDVIDKKPTENIAEYDSEEDILEDKGNKGFDDISNLGNKDLKADKGLEER